MAGTRRVNASLKEVVESAQGHLVTEEDEAELLRIDPSVATGPRQIRAILPAQLSAYFGFGYSP